MDRLMNLRYVVLFAFLFAAIEQPASAYADPGSGLLLWQVAGAAFVGFMFQIRRLTGWFRSRKRN
jgi:hypothetical protein